jgi:AcrR family transcriptional regulator
MGDPERLLELLWGEVEPPKRGPKPSLTVQQIVATAIDVADAEGLGAVSMHRLAKELEVTAMSLYRYVPSKDDLLELMFDAAVGEPPSDLVAGGFWRADLARWARLQKDFCRSRPWTVELPISGPPMGPNNLAWMNAALEALAGTGLTEADKLLILLLLTVYVRGESMLGLQISEASERTGVTELERLRVYATLMQRVADDDRFPALARLARSGIFEEEDDDPDEDFEFGLQRILDGVQVLVDSRAERI